MHSVGGASHSKTDLADGRTSHYGFAIHVIPEGKREPSDQLVMMRERRRSTAEGWSFGSSSYFRYPDGSKPRKPAYREIPHSNSQAIKVASRRSASGPKPSMVSSGHSSHAFPSKVGGNTPDASESGGCGKAKEPNSAKRRRKCPTTAAPSHIHPTTSATMPSGTISGVVI